MWRTHWSLTSEDEVLPREKSKAVAGAQCEQVWNSGDDCVACQCWAAVGITRSKGL